MPYQPGIKEALLDWGLTVVEVDGWQTRGSSDFDPRGFVFHHDVVPDAAGTDDRAPDLIVRDGNATTPPPLANFWLETDGDVHLVAAGTANHAGRGGWNGLSGNSSVWGMEANNLGTPDHPWPEVQLEAAARTAAACAEFSGFSIANVCGHKEWAPDRKIDPHTINMAAFRRQVELQEKEQLTMADIEALRQTIIRQHQKDREQQRRIAEREGRLDAAGVKEIVAAIEGDE